MKKILLSGLAILFFSNLHAQIFIGTKISKQRSRTLDKALTEYEVFSLDANSFDQFIKAPNYEGEVTLKLGDKNWEMILFENDIRSENYITRVITPNGIIKQPKGENITFKGALKNDASSKIRLTVKGSFIHGVIKTSGGEYFIEPAKKYATNYSDNSYLLYNVKNVIPDSEHRCGVVEVKKFKEEKINEQPESFMMTCLEVELAVLSDFVYFQEYGPNVGGSTAQVIAVMNAVNTDYDTDFNNEIEFKIVEHVVSTCADCDPINTSVDLSNSLSEFTNWGNNNGFVNNFDLGQLWVGVNSNSINGLASVGVVCSSFKYHAMEDSGFPIEHNLRVLTSHEIGHNFDCSHDPNGSGTIMSTPVNNTTTWSAVSIASVNGHLADPAVNCLAVCPASICEPVTNVSVSNTNTSFTASWTASPAGEYRVILYDSDDTELYNNTITTTSVSITPPLVLCNDYRISIESFCGGSDYSARVVSIITTGFASDFEILCVKPFNCSSGNYDLEVNLTHGGGNASGFDVTADGVTQHFNYTASPQTVTVTGLTGNGNTATPVSVIATSGGGGDCDASTTYREPSSDCTGVLFEATFNDCKIPSSCGWSTTTTVTTFSNFIFKSDWLNHPHVNFNDGDFDGSCFAFFDDDINSNIGFSGTITMTTPVIDLTGYSGVTLDFDYNFYPFDDSFPNANKGPNDSQFDVEVFDGTNWVNVLSDDDNASGCFFNNVWSTGNNCLTDFSTIVDTYSNANFQVKFIYTDGGTGDYTGMIAIDNVVVSATTHSGGCSTFVDYYPDTDGDGYGDGTQTPTQVCLGDPPPSGYVTNDTDCDDGNANDVDLVFNSTVPAGLHQANNSITSIGFVPNSGAAPGFITFQAGVTIFLTPGFVAESGSDFTAKIEPCSSAPSPLVQPLDEGIVKVPDNDKEEISTPKSKVQLLVYPNPTKERTFIEFDLKESDQVNLLVFDARGNVVNKLLENKSLGIGNHQMSFETNELPIGIYTVFLRLGEKMIAKRLIVQKD